MKTEATLLAIILSFTCATQGSAGEQTTRQIPGASSSSPSPAEKNGEDCGCEAKAPADGLATVNGVNIANKDVDEMIKDRVQELQNQVTEARKRQLDLEINSRLLEAEAKRLGIPADKLLKREIGHKIKEPTDAEAQAFYDQNKAQMQGEFKDVKGQVVNYLRGQRQQDGAKKFADRLRLRAQVKVLIDNVTPPSNDADRARLFATVNGKRITSGDVEDSLKALIFSVQDQVYNLRKQALDMRINDALLTEQAKKKNVAAEALYNSEIRPRVKPVTEEDARKLYEENNGRVEGTFEQLRAQIFEYLQGREQTNAATAYAEELRKGASIQLYLKPPEAPVFEISIDDRPWRGGVNAQVTIVEFTDYECPSCAATQPILEEVAKEFGDKVKLVARNFPLDQHKHAFKAAEAAEAAREQGKYWEYAELIFKNQKELEVEKLKAYAGQLGLDQKRFDAALDSGRLTDKVKRDLADGEKIGVDSTPSVFLNGRRVRDRSREALKSAIEAALKESAKKS